MTDAALASSHTDLRAQLEATLGDAFVIERELGGGGMSRVFLARETSLGRRVVVKVLPPELRGVNLDRFRREILLAAQLQHPHIVPVLAAGEAAGAPWFTMPFIEGESLRARLARGETLATADAVRILLDVIDALAYAHDRGIVHRDIKPDNILMSAQHAVVTDFGVAKALTSAVSGGRWAVGDTLTAHSPEPTAPSLAIGTPQYMAPEQAAADPDVDHRADIYAFGILAYELLAGRSPFAGRPHRETLVAHLTEVPAGLERVRGDVPPALAALVARCLAKPLEDRPQSAAEVRQALEAMVTPSGGIVAAGRGPGVRRRLLAAVGAAAALALAVAGYRVWPRAAVVDDAVVAVAPFHVTSADPSLRYLREGMLDLLAAKLTGEAGPRSADPRGILGAWRRAAGSDTADLPRARALEVAEGLGAGHLLVGEVGGTAARLVLSASMIGVRDGRAEATVSVAGPADSLPQLADQLAARLLTLGAGEQERLATLTTTSLPALRAFLAGQAQYRAGHFREAGREFDRALSLDSTFALAGVGIARASTWFPEFEIRQRGVEAAHRYRDRLSARDRALLDAFIGPRYPAFATGRELFQAKERYLTLAPDQPEAWFEVGDFLYHWGASIGVADAHERAQSGFQRALSLDSAFTPAIEHLLLLAARNADTALVRRLMLLHPTMGSGTDTSENADGLRWRAAVALGDRKTRDEILARRATLRTQSVQTILSLTELDGLPTEDARLVSEALAARKASDFDRGLLTVERHDLAMTLGRPREALATFAALPAPYIANSAHRRDQIRDAMFGEGDTLAALAAVSALEPSAVGAPPAGDQPRGLYYADVCWVEMWKLSRGDARTAANGIRRLRAGSAERTQFGELRAPFTDVCATILDAMLASVENRPDVRAQVQRLDSVMLAGQIEQLQVAGNLVVARLRDRLGDHAGALAAVRRRDYYISRDAYLATYVREEGRLAAVTGDREGALRAYRHYLALRADPDPALLPDRDAVRAEVAKLEGRRDG